MIAVYKYFKGCHVEEQLELFFTSPKGETKTNGWKNVMQTDFQFYKQIKHSNCQGNPKLDAGMHNF